MIKNNVRSGRRHAQAVKFTKNAMIYEYVFIVQKSLLNINVIKRFRLKITAAKCNLMKIYVWEPKYVFSSGRVRM